MVISKTHSSNCALTSLRLAMRSVGIKIWISMCRTILRAITGACIQAGYIVATTTWRTISSIVRKTSYATSWRWWVDPVGAGPSNTKLIRPWTRISIRSPIVADRHSTTMIITATRNSCSYLYSTPGQRTIALVAITWRTCHLEPGI